MVNKQVQYLVSWGIYIIKYISEIKSYLPNKMEFFKKYKVSISYFCFFPKLNRLVFLDILLEM